MRKGISIDKIIKFLETLADFNNYEVTTVEGGISTDVYKLVGKRENLYLRLSDVGKNISTEVLAHKLILEKGVPIPKVLIYEDFNKTLDGYSFMITTEIPGVSAQESKKKDIHEAVVEAGRQIALINTIPVEGFGWMDHDNPNETRLRGECSTYEEFALETPKDSKIRDYLVNKDILSKETIDNYIKYLDDNEGLVECTQAHLAHGDFYLSHIFVDGEKFSGFIDFGDVRGTSIYNDLAHFYVYSREYFDDLIKGYVEITPLERDFIKKVVYVGMLFSIGKLYWISNSAPYLLDKRRNEIDLLSETLGTTSNNPPTL